MPLTVVVGGQFGSEGKGKVSQLIAQNENAAAVIRVGGPNSGHTGIEADGTLCALRQLPTAALVPGVACVLPPGAIIDPEIFLREVSRHGLSPERVKVDPWATIIAPLDKEAERASGIVQTLGSTGSGTGHALERRVARQSSNILAKDCPAFSPFICDTLAYVRRLLREHELVVIEGTQGYGLSVLHGGFYPKATSRDTTAAGFVAEAGLSPLDVTDVVLVIRTFPIRVGGNSGPLMHETTWDVVANEARLAPDYCELTTATRKVRRVGRFDPQIVRRAIMANRPSQIVLNHLDYVDHNIRCGRFTPYANSFVTTVEASIDASIDLIGTDERTLTSRKSLSVSTLGEVRRPPAIHEGDDPAEDDFLVPPRDKNKENPARSSPEDHGNDCCFT